MRTVGAAILTGAIILMASHHARAETVTTTVRNGDSVATVTQSGDPATTVKKVEKRPGYTRLEQKSGNSSSVVVQSQSPADLKDMKMPGDLPPEFRDMIPPEYRHLFGK